MVDDVVGGVAHTKQGAGRVEVTRHARPHVHIFTDSLGANAGINDKLKTGYFSQLAFPSGLDSKNIHLQYMQLSFNVQRPLDGLL